MQCVSQTCRQGRDICTRAECGYVLDEHDRAALRLDAAMNHPLATSAEAQDRIKADEDSPESAIGMALRLGKTAAIVIAAVAAAWAAAWYFPAWPWLVDKLAF